MLENDIVELKTELDDLEEFLNRPENNGKKYGTSTDTVYIGKPTSIKFDEGIEMLKKGFDKMLIGKIK
jgi:hypothetical protein